MSMNLFFRAFTQAEIDAMAHDTHLIDAWVEAENYALAADIETAWDVLATVLGGTGILVGKQIDNALFNGCMLISAAAVKQQAEHLSQWTHAEVLAQLRNVDDDADLYHIDYYREEEDDLLAQFDSLAAFYKTAAAQGLAALSYLA